MRLAVIGAGYVGLVTGVGLAELGHEVAVGEADPDRLELLNQGFAPFHEPGLEEAMRRAQRAGVISFHSSNAEAVRGADVVFVAVPTPAASNGDADLRSVDRVIDDIAAVLSDRAIVVLKSTVPVGTTRRLQQRLRTAGCRAVAVSNPEFLQAGRALTDFVEPSRVVVGSDEAWAADVVAGLFAPLGRPILITDPESAELIKYGSNAYLAVRLSYVNEIAELSAAVDADAATVLAGIGLDPRIGSAYLEPGPGFGGSCLPKDSTALVNLAGSAGARVLSVEAALAVNQAQRRRNLDRVLAALGPITSGKTVALWGLSFKAGTDDVRDSPAMWLVEDLAPLGVTIQACDAMARVEDARIERFADPLEAAKKADVLVVATAWPEFADVDLWAVREGMRGKAVVDLRGVLDAESVTRHGLDYVNLRDGNGVRPRPDDRLSA